MWKKSQKASKIAYKTVLTSDRVKQETDVELRGYNKKSFGHITCKRTTPMGAYFGEARSILEGNNSIGAFTFGQNLKTIAEM